MHPQQLQSACALQIIPLYSRTLQYAPQYSAILRSQCDYKLRDPLSQKARLAALAVLEEFAPHACGAAFGGV